MQFLVDQDVYHITIQWLKEADHDVVTASDLRMERATDRELLHRSRQTERLFVTRDKDFGTLVYLGGFEAIGVILLRMLPTNIAKVHSEFERLLSEHSAEELQNLFLSWSPIDIVYAGFHRLKQLTIDHHRLLSMVSILRDYGTGQTGFPCTFLSRKKWYENES